MTGKLTGQGQKSGGFVSGWSAASAERLNRAIKRYGSKTDAARAAGVSRQSLTEMLRFDELTETGSRPKHKNLEALCSVIGVDKDDVLGAREVHNLAVASLGPSGLPTSLDIVTIPALNIQASAGDGLVAASENHGPGPFHFAGDWLRNKFGSIASLKLVQVKGDSQEPDMHGGDWVLIDEARNEVENGLAVVRLDDCLMIKWLQREGHMLRLISRNPQYLPTVLDLRKDEDRVKVIGRAVFMLKAL